MVSGECPLKPTGQPSEPCRILDAAGLFRKTQTRISVLDSSICQPPHEAVLGFMASAILLGTSEARRRNHELEHSTL
jgi:hypothetical protein